MTKAEETILLVEDDPNDALLVQRAFRQAKLANPIQVLRDGDEAVEYLAGQASQPEPPRPLVLMLLDLKLPRRSGLEVLAWVRQQPALRRLPIVMFTSSRDPAHINRAYDTGVNSYLVKPVAASALVDMMKTLHRYWATLNERPDLRHA